MVVTDLVNIALAKIGQKKIMDINETTTETAEAARLLYPLARDVTLAYRHWNRLTRRASLPAIDLTDDTTGILLEWTNAYGLPADCLTVRRIIADFPQLSSTRFHPAGPEPFRIEILEGQQILVCNLTSCNILYTARIEDVNTWGDVIRDCVIERLASDLAGALPKDMKLQDAHLKMWVYKMENASGVDEAEGGKDEFIPGDLIGVRSL